MREFRLVRKGKADRVWSINNEGDTYRTFHGQLHGKLQENSDTPGSIGKFGTKAFKNPELNCEIHIKREVKKKTEAGYIEYVGGLPTEERVDRLTWNEFAPKVFCGYKPQTSITDKALAKLHEDGLARYTRKYDGMSHVCIHHTWGWEIYSRRMDLVTDKFPLHVKRLAWESSLPAGTVVVGEMVCFKADGTDDFKAMSRVSQSDPELARQIIDDEEVPEPTYVIFDILFRNKHCLKDRSYDERSRLWKYDFVAAADRDAEVVCSVDYFDLTPDTWEDYCKKNKWEGFVVVDGSAIPGDKFFSFDGKPKRWKGTHKLKPVYEDDFVIYAGRYGTGKRRNGVGSVFVKQIHPETGEWFACGKVGSGFTDEGLVEIEALIAKHGLPILEKDKDAEELDLSDGSGIVAMIEFSERQVGTNKLRFPVYKRVRFDKAIDECEAQKLAVEE